MIITICLFLVGYIITGLLKVNNKLERLSLGFFLAFGLVGFTLFGLTAKGVRLDKNMPLFIVGVAVVCLALSFKDIMKSRIRGWRWIIILIFGLSLVINLYWPPITWDTLTLYDFRAKLFAGGISYRDLYLNLSKYGGDFGYYTYGYPPLLSLVTSLSYLLNESIMPIFSGALLAFVFLFYSLLERYSSKKVGIVFSLILATTSIIFYHSTIFYSNLFYSVLLSLATIYLFDFSKTKKTKSLFFCYLLLIISSWIRMTEPFYILIFLLSVKTVFSLKKTANIICCVGLIMMTLLSRNEWHIYTASISEQTTSIVSVSKTLVSPVNYLTGVVHTLGTFDVSKISEIFNYLIQATDIYFYLIVSFVLLGISKIKHSVHNLVFWFVVLSYLTMILGIVYFSITVPFWEDIVDSARRMIIFTIPCMLFYIGIITDNKEK